MCLALYLNDLANPLSKKVKKRQESFAHPINGMKQK